ncbi:MAG TPA: sigma-70 family RNA polymerase sigma factor [Candidatus Dormibacteraeota bacterium]|nr:sigma-70 family RNA polymerase sigma factor [Candidatus Dormibacteraeota bacterium]
MGEDDSVLTAVRSGDESSFGAITERYRRQLHVHCYRMTGSVDDAEDLVQETMLRAWRSRANFEGRSSFRNWLYRIATNACLNALERSPRRVTAPDVAPATKDPRSTPKWATELPWLQPYPDALLEPAAPHEAEPEAVVAARETIQLVYLAAIQHLPPRQRAVLILRDALDWSAKETADLLDMTLPSVNSALHRARTTMRDALPHEDETDPRVTRPTNEEQALLQRFMDAFERADAASLTSILREDARLTMPPALMWFDGRDSVMGLYRQLLGPDSFGDFKLVATAANRQPAAVSYLRARGKREYRLTGLNVLRIVEGAIAEVTAFRPDLCTVFNLPRSL